MPPACGSERDVLPPEKQWTLRPGALTLRAAFFAGKKSRRAIVCLDRGRVWGYTVP